MVENLLIHWETNLLVNIKTSPNKTGEKQFPPTKPLYTALFTLSIT